MGNFRVGTSDPHPRACVAFRKRTFPLTCPASAGSRALDTQADQVDRLGGAHPQPVALGTAEGDVGAGLGQADAADALAIAITQGWKPSNTDASGLASSGTSAQQAWADAERASKAKSRR